MESSPLHLASTGSEELMARRSEYETPEFDITAMVDLVFMMNIYFLVTFVTVALGELKLPAANHCIPLDGETAIVLTLTRSLDGKSATLYIGDGAKTEPITDPSLQEQRIQAAVEQGIAQGKKAVLIKGEDKVPMGQYDRIAKLAVAVNADGPEKVKLYDAVLEKED
jgi:biopolymer transport protein ExbD